MHKQFDLNQSNGIVAKGKGGPTQLIKESNLRYFTCYLDKLKLKEFSRNSRENAEKFAKEKFVLLFRSDIQVGNMTFPVKQLFLCGTNEKYSII